MKRPFLDLYRLVEAMLPFLLLLLGGLGIVYSLALNNSNTPFMVICLIVLLIGISLYTYQQAMKSEFFKQRFGIKQKKSGHKHKRSGKRCPQCERLIHHRRTVCQHCGYLFPSHKEGEEAESASSHRESQS